MNLGKVTVIKYLGATMILREPGKSSNAITTDPKNRMILADREGKILAKPYLDWTGIVSSVCRVKVNRVTVFH